MENRHYCIQYWIHKVRAIENDKRYWRNFPNGNFFFISFFFLLNGILWNGKVWVASFWLVGFRQFIFFFFILGEFWMWDFLIKCIIYTKFFFMVWVEVICSWMALISLGIFFFNQMCCMLNGVNLLMTVDLVGKFMKYQF